MVGRISHHPAEPRGCGRGHGLWPSVGSAVRLSRGIGCGRMACMAVPAHGFYGLCGGRYGCRSAFGRLYSWRGGVQESA